MNKIILFLLILFAWGTSLTAQITREQADSIVIQHIKKDVKPPSLLYLYNQVPSANEIVITTHNEEKMKIKYVCWAYYVNENPKISEHCQHRYLFVKEDNGNLLEIITSNDLVPSNLEAQWTFVDSIMVSVRKIEKEPKILLYPNPTTGELRITYHELGIDNIEIFDIYGRKVSSHHLIPSSSHHIISISHLTAGIYFVRIKDVTQKVIKN